jgi:hypothetical protein
MDASTTIRLPTLPDTKNKEEAPKCAAAIIGACSEASDTVKETGKRSLSCSAAMRVPCGPLRIGCCTMLGIRRLGAGCFFACSPRGFDPAKGAAHSWIFQIAHRRGISRHRYLTLRYFYQQVDLDNLAGELEDPKTTIQHGRSIQEMFGESDFRQRFGRALSEPARPCDCIFSRPTPLLK